MSRASLAAAMKLDPGAWVVFELSGPDNNTLEGQRGQDYLSHIKSV